MKRKKLFTRNEKKLFMLIINIIKALAIGVYDIFIYVGKMLKMNRRLLQIGIGYDEVLKMIYSVNPRQFEIFIAELFKCSGKYDKVEITKATNDYGRDVILTRRIKGHKEVTFVEVKHFAKNNYIGRPVVQKLLGSCQMLGADKGIVITTGKFNKNAYDCLVKVNNLQLMDIVDIQKMILDLDSSQVSRLMVKTLNVS